ncbi:CDGSH iron-sulfur domain-containing protein [Cognatiyoonia sp. IB215446]|uniref:CDGSH iron-sulfur domain-containing protein n=1 Tax=Cognatiyoonia sp. IB215446 TaxID=3097355 RepID=UPI002A10788F|nr:CDGSH iron-sulfur domain-containing protein [Cognatiyoonia sp. IB215446]MDX8348140.1 CDGSH iron-sulfur domain-containing protein [Cognatiyoonia sp. IB215446]
MTDISKVTLAENGPLIVENPPALTGAFTQEAESKPRIALCRCGASSNKPFCDGTHTKIAFSSTSDRSALRNTPIAYSGDVDGTEVTISYTPVLCTHAAECQARANAVFGPSAKPWIQPGNGKLTEILDVIAACPSGALRVAVGQVPEQHMTTGDVAIEIEKDGPYRIRNIPLEAEFNGAGASRAKYTLCRCGLSKNKPFCDGTHHDEKWSDDNPAD